MSTYLLSERTLNVLLGLGAFLILTAALVISTVNPTGLGPLPHCAAMLCTTLVFYAAGIVAQSRLTMARAGATLLAIAAAFIPLDLCTFGRDALVLDASAIWLFTSALSVPIYLVSHRCLYSRTSAVLSAASGCSLVLALTCQLGVAPVWGGCGLLILGGAYLLLAHRLREDWANLSAALFLTAQMAAPIAMAVLLALRLGPDLVPGFLPAPFLQALGARPGAGLDYALGTTWWLGAMFYVLSARLFRRRAFSLLASWAIPGAYLITLSKAPFTVEWYGVALAILAAIYMLIGYQIRGTRARAAHPTFRQLLDYPLYQVGLTLSVLAGLWPAAMAPRGVASAGEAVTLWLLVGLAAWSAIAFRHLPFRYAAAYLLPVTLACTGSQHGSMHFPHAAWLPDQPSLGLVVLAACYVLVGRLTLGCGPGAGRPLTYRALLREPLFQVAALFMLAAALWPVLTFQARFVSAPEITTLVALALLCGGSACILDQRGWAYAGVALVPVVCGLILALNACGAGTSLLAWAALAAALWITAEVSALRSAESRRPLVETVIGLGTWRSRFTSPLFLTAYATSLLPVFIGLVQAHDLARTSLQSIVALLLVCVIFTLSAVTRRAGLFLYAAMWLFPMPVAALAAHAYALAGQTFTLAQAARLLALLGLGYLGLALPAGRAGERYAGPLYWTAYAFATLGVILAIPDRSIVAQTLGMALLGLAWSAWLVHTGRHPSYAAAVGRLVEDTPAAWLDVIEILFQYVGIWLLPLWLLLLQSLWQPALAPADCGLALALLAVLFALAGLCLGHIHAAYRLPWLLAACAMSALGPLTALPDSTLRVAALAVSVAFYVACAGQSRRHEWLWPAATLGPVLLLELLVLIGLPVDVHTTALVGLSLAYGLTGLVIQQVGSGSFLLRLRERHTSFAMPFLVVGQGLCALGLLYSPAAQSPELMLVCWSLGALQYGASAGISRRSVFSAPLALSLAVAFVSGMVVCAVPLRYVGPALLLGVGTFFAIGETLRRTMDAADITAERGPRAGITSWAWPFDACMHVGAVASFLLCATDIGQMPAWWAIAALYTALAALRHKAVWLYPGVGSALAAYLGTGVLLLPNMAFSARLLALTPVAGALFWLAHDIARRQAEGSGLVTACLNVRGVFADRWAAPCLAWGITTLAASTVLSSGQAVLLCTPVHLAVAVASLLLLSVFSLLWLSRLLAYAAVAVLTVAIAEALALAGVPWGSLAPVWAAAALVEALVTAVLQRSRGVAARLWAPPLTRASYLAGVLAVIAAVAGLFVGWYALQSLATTLSLIGAYLLMRGIVARTPLPLHLGLGLLTGAYLCELVFLHMFQLQAFTLPLGIVLLFGAYREWRRGATTSKAVLELAAIAVLLGTTLVQACGGFGVGDGRFGYDTLLLLESAVVIGAGAVLRWRRLFFAACGVLVTDVCILLIDPVRSMPAWYLMAIIGFAMIGLVMFLEQRRQKIPLWMDDVRERLETWD